MFQTIQTSSVLAIVPAEWGVSFTDAISNPLSFQSFSDANIGDCKNVIRSSLHDKFSKYVWKNAAKHINIVSHMESRVCSQAAHILIGLTE